MTSSDTTSSANILERLASANETIEKTRKLINPGRMDWLAGLGIDLVMGRRDACHVWSVDGRCFIDVLCDGTTFNFGHRNAHLISTLRKLLDSYDIGCQFLASKPRAELAELLVRNSPDGLNMVHFVPSGSEANDAAIKAAIRATGKNRIVTIDRCFHGVTGLAAKATGGSVGASLGDSITSEDWPRIPWNDLDAAEAAFASGDVAAILVETIPAMLGWPMPRPDYFRGLRSLCDHYGVMLIVDEIQTGLGRCGRLWAIDHWDVRPDMLVMAKGAGGGIYPLAYVLMNDAAASWTRDAPLTMPSTFGGSEIGCALGAEVVRLATNPAFLARVNKFGLHLGARLDELQQRHPDAIAEVRQLGLGVAIRFHDDLGGLKMMTALFEQGVLAIAAAGDLSVIQVKPPLIIALDVIDQLSDAIDAAVRKCFVEKTVSANPDWAHQFIS